MNEERLKRFVIRQFGWGLVAGFWIGAITVTISVMVFFQDKDDNEVEISGRTAPVVIKDIYLDKPIDSTEYKLHDFICIDCP